MVDVFNPRIDGGPVNENEYFFRIRYRAAFDPAELNDTFSEFVRLREQDGALTLGDDHLTAANPVNFVAAQASINRTFAVIIPREVADTEGGIHDAGHEEIYAEIWLRSSQNPGDGPEGADRHVFTDVGDFDP